MAGESPGDCPRPGILLLCGTACPHASPNDLGGPDLEDKDLCLPPTRTLPSPTAEEAGAQRHCQASEGKDWDWHSDP